MKETVTYKDIRGNKEINQLIEKGNEILGVLGYTEHLKEARGQGWRRPRPKY